MHLQGLLPMSMHSRRDHREQLVRLKLPRGRHRRAGWLGCLSRGGVEMRQQPGHQAHGDHQQGQKGNDGSHAEQHDLDALLKQCW